MQRALTVLIADATGTKMMDMGSYHVLVNGANLLNTKCHLKLIVERNLDSWNSHNVPDISVHGTLSRLEAVLDLQQYKLIRGFLDYNLGEPIDDLSIDETSYLADSLVNLLNDKTVIDFLLHIKNILICAVCRNPLTLDTFGQIHP